MFPNEIRLHAFRKFISAYVMSYNCENEVFIKYMPLICNHRKLHLSNILAP